MTKPHVSDGRQRRSKRFKTLHIQLAAECAPRPEPDKLTSRKAKSAEYRQCGGP